MALNTDFNVSPYFDDYNEEKNFHRVLFRPAVPIQARELTQLQTILQNQVERFGDNIYRQGTIIKGCSLNFDFNYTYVKINDLQVDGQTTLVSDYANSYLENIPANNQHVRLKSEIVNYVQGLESQNPDLSTLFIKYINTGTGGKKTYANGDVLSVFARDYSIQSITIDSAGTLYNNTNVIVFTSNTGTGASANIVTYANGSIRDVVITDGGSGYTTAPTLTITTSTGSSGALTALNYIAQIRVANSSFTAPVGTGAAVTIGDGTIYQRGHFVRVEEQTAIIDKYSNQPSNVALGFTTSEAIVNNSVDSTLLDNAQGYSNFTAPGSHRLKLTPTFVAISTANAAANTEFLSILEFQNGTITKRRTGTEFNSVATEMAKRTREESGNYVVRPFTIFTEEGTSNTTHLNLSVSSGLGYVDGFRTEVTGTIRLPVRKGTDTAISNNQTISANFGNYVVVTELLGNFDFSTGGSVNLRNTAATDNTDNFGGAPTSPGTIIGTANIRSLVHESGTPGNPDCRYRIYLFNVVMNSSESFTSVRQVQISGGVADVVLEEGVAVLKETSFDSLIFSSGAAAIEQLANERFIYRKVSTVSIATSGVFSSTLTGVEEFTYTPSSTLNDTQELEFIIIPSSNAHSSTNLSGTVSSSGNVVTGTSTDFIADFDVGDHIKFSGNNLFYKISSISSATSLSIVGTTGPAASSNSYSYGFPKNIPLRLNRGTANIAIDSTGKIATVYAGNTFNQTTSATLYFNSKVDGASPKAKSVVKNVYVKLSTAKLAANTLGPWCIGVPDAYKLVAVYVGSSNTYSNSTTNYASSFELITGQNDNTYGLSYIRKKPGSSLSLSATNNLLVRVDLFTHGAGYYLSTESYPVDDVTTTLPSNKIRTEDIPFYISPKNKQYYNLRDVIDFRPVVANTANASATSVAGATIDPTNTEVLTGDLYFPTPNESFEADITHYLNRIDTIVIDAFSSVTVIEGIPDKNPVAPRPTDGTMKLATINVPPYPSLSPKQANESKRFEYSTLIRQDQIRGYTMQDIKQIEDRINRLEFYSLLNTLEQNASDLIIPSEANNQISRFKNGFFVDSFTSYDISNVNDPEYAVYVDTTTGTARPQIEKTRVTLIANTAASSNVTFKGEYALLEYTETPFISQPIANKTRNPVQLAWSFKGNVRLFPRYDDYYDIKAGSVNMTIDLATPLNALTKTINDNVTFKKDSQQINVETGTFTNLIAATTQAAGVQQATQTTTTTTVTNAIVPGATVISKEKVGDFLTDFAMKPFIRAQIITFVAVGLRPNAQHFVFFDKVNVSNLVRQADSTNITQMKPSGIMNDPTVKFKGQIGDTLTSDDKGVLIGAIHIPDETFFVGDRSVIISDSNNLDDGESGVSFARTSFNAYNFSKSTTELTLTTKVPGAASIQSNTTVDVAKTLVFQATPQLPRPGGGGKDPLAQTFNIDRTDGSDGVYITSVDLFFKAKDATLGITVQLRETVNGVPSPVVVAEGFVINSSINISNTAALATTVTFDTPAYCKSRKDYCIVIIPDQFSPEFLLWVAEIGLPDVANNNLISTTNWGSGSLFLSQNDSVWTPYQSEDLKFKAYIANFSKTSGTVVLENAPHEFLTLSNTSGSFVSSEEVAQKSNTYLTGTFTANTSNAVVNTSSSQVGTVAIGEYVLIVYANTAVLKTGTVSASNTTLVGTSTLFTTEYSAGDYLLINNNIREVVSIANTTQLTLDAPLSSSVSANAHSGVSEKFQIVRVNAANSSTITLKDNPLYVIDGGSTFYGSLQKVVRATVDVVNNDGTLTLRESTAANSTFKFEANKTIVGEVSQATATITSVDNKTVNFTESYLRYIAPPTNSVGLIQKIDGLTATAANSAMAEGVSNNLKYEGQIKSRSNEIASGSKSYKMFVNLSSTPTFNNQSPAIDIEPASVVALENIINNDNSGETSRYGNSQVRYISKNVALADGLDAEDMRVYVTAYKPSTSDIYVYAKILASDDNQSFDNRDWTLLDQLTEGNLYSDSLNEGNFIEYEYGFSLTPPSTSLTGVITSSTNTTITGSGTSFSADIAANDVVKIVQSNTLTGYDIGVVDAVANNTQFTLKAATSFTGIASIEKVTQPGAAFKYNDLSNVINGKVVYLDSNKALHLTYKTFAIKIVSVSSSTKFIPILKDVRALAISI